MPQPSESWEQDHFETLIRNGIAAVKGGNRDAAQRLLNRALQIKTADPRPWLWLSATTDNLEEQRLYLERAVAADPGNATVRRGLVLLSEKLDKTRLVPEGATVEPRRPQEPEEAQAQAFICPNCGGQVQFDIAQGGLACPYCGYRKSVEAQPAADIAEQPIDFILPTTPAHRWAEAQQRLSCEHCGSVILLPPGQQADRCVYCGSNRLAVAAESVELIEPHAIALMKLSERQAYDQVKRWLSLGWLVPDDLTRRAGRFTLRPAYYPFWTFDGTLEVNWHCEVNEGIGRVSHWVSRSGTEFEHFDDILVPGLRRLSTQAIAAIEPFDLKDIVAFSSEFLAGWVALGYDLPLADASLRAREKVIKDLRKDLYRRVAPGLGKRNLASGGGKWSGLTFKYLLLPLWVGSFTYRGQVYRMLVNGQSGKVGGNKPRDPAKFWMITLGVIITVVVLVILAYFLYLWFRGG